MRHSELCDEEMGVVFLITGLSNSCPFLLIQGVLENSEISINCNDKILNIKWPINKKILSKKDKGAMSFTKYLKN